MQSPQRFSGLLTRRERWGLSWRGWLIALLVLLGIGWLLLLGIYPFLAVTHRVDTKVLVVEGWVEDYVILTGSEEFKSGNYDQVFTTGGLPPGSVGYTSEDHTTAVWGAHRLIRSGIARERVQSTPCRAVDRDRTYRSAIALRDWLHEHGTSVKGINIVTEAVHARRTRLLFQKALGESVAVGIIAVQSPEFDPRHWWRSSDGVREVLSESIAYLYARLIFVPSDLDSP